MIKSFTLSAFVLASSMIQPASGMLYYFRHFNPDHNEIAQRAMARLAAGHRITFADDASNQGAIMERLAAGVRNQREIDQDNPETQRAQLRILAEDTRMRLKLAKLLGDTYAICQQAALLEYFNSRLTEIRKNEERDKAHNQQEALEGMGRRYLRDLSVRLQDSTLTSAQRDALQADYNRVNERQPNQPLKHRIQMNRVLEELEGRAALRTIRAVVNEDDSHMAHIIRMAMRN